MKKSKKFVLAALALLAITGLLALTSCKNDSVPPEVTSGTETKPVTHTVTFNTDGGSTVASQTVESGQKAKEPAADPTLEGSWFLGWYSDEGLAKKFDFNTPITTATPVYAKWSYKLHIKPTTLTNYTSPHAPSTGTWTYVEFGDWPQTILKGDVKVDETKSKEMGMFTYYLGDDGNHYVKEEENANGAGYKYSNGEQAGQGGTSTKWFKVEPIVWRVLTEDYKDPDGKSTGNALLLAEKILTGGIKWADSSNNYMQSYIRQWLNGNSGTGETSDYGGDAGFLQTAFTADAQSLIAVTTVDNSVTSTFGTGENTQENPYACDKTKDKIFLLSQQEATNSEYGFGAYSEKDSARIRVTTDYAKATGAHQGYFLADDGWWWWLRSPNCDSVHGARVIIDDGSADYDEDRDDVIICRWGVVPALSISLQ